MTRDSCGGHALEERARTYTEPFAFGPSSFLCKFHVGVSQILVSWSFYRVIDLIDGLMDGMVGVKNISHPTTKNTLINHIIEREQEGLKEKNGILRPWMGFLFFCPFLRVPPAACIICAETTKFSLMWPVRKNVRRGLFLFLSIFYFFSR